MRRTSATFRAIPGFLVLLHLLLGAAGFAEAVYEPEEVGGSVLWAQVVEGGWAVGVRKRLLPWLEAAFASDGEDLFEPEMRIHVVRDLPPVRMALAIGPEWVSFLTQLRLGPVHAAMGRRWGQDPLRWGAVIVAGGRLMALSAGWRTPGGLCAEVSIHVASSLRWEVSLFFRDGSVGMGVAAWL